MSKIVHFEIAADDPEKLAEFYINCFDWKIEEWKMPEVKEENRYWIIKAGPKDEIGADGGMYKRRESMAPGGPNAFVCNIAVADIEKAVEKIRANGGTAEKIMDITGVGRSAAAKDPEGNMFSVLWSDPNAVMQDM